MITGLVWIGWIAILWILVFYRCSPKIWLPVTFLCLAAWSYFLYSPVSLAILWSFWIVLALLSIAPLRYKLLTLPFLRWFQRENPPLSAEEQQVIDAGGIWWGNQLFSGEPNWRELLATGKPTLSAQEQAFLDHHVSALCDLLDEWKICYQDHDLSKEAWHYIKTQKFWGLEIDPNYGGLGFSPLAHAVIISKIATRSVSAAITVMVPNSLGPAEFLKYYGTQAQKEYYLPRLARGEEISCFALTGIEAGSDAASITDTGVVCYGEYAGQRVLGLRLNWNKRYITLAPIATLIGLAFRMLDPDHLLGTQTDIGITLALIPSHLPGVEKGPRHFPLNMGFMNGPLRGKEVFIPLDHIIGGVEQRGKGWQMMMECLVVGRGISLPSLATAMAQFCWRMSSAYAVVRRQFNRPIAKFEGIQQTLARIGGLTYLCDAIRNCTVEAIQTGSRPAVASAISKYHLTEFARRIVADSMDIHAGFGIQLGPRNYLGFLHDAVPINITVEGANILTRGLIIYGQGVLRCHPYLRSELSMAMAKDTRGFDKVFCRHLGFTISHCARLVVYGVTGGRWIFRNQPDFYPQYFQQLTRMSNAFVILTDITLLVLGKRLKIKESLSARLGDVISHLYMAVTVLKSFHDRGQPPDEKIFVEWSVTYCFGEIQTAMIDFLANFPQQWLAKILRRLIFPLGQAYSRSTDQLGAKMAKSMQENNALRKRLSQDCYFSPGSSAWRMEQAMQSVLNVESLLQKIKAAAPLTAQTPSVAQSQLTGKIQQAYQQKIITDSERDQLQLAADLCWDAIQVDEFLNLGNRYEQDSRFTEKNQQLL